MLGSASYEMYIWHSVALVILQFGIDSGCINVGSYSKMALFVVFMIAFSIVINLWAEGRLKKLFCKFFKLSS